MKVHSFTVLPTTPERLKPLLEIANNLWFSWNWDARQLFSKLDNDTWTRCHKNPLKTLCHISQRRLEEAAQNRTFISELETVYASFKKYISGKTWFEEQYGPRQQPVVAYFSAEYGLHESLPIYSGGLGVLSGDHLKSASDLGIPLVAIGLFYQHGYFRQGLNSDGMQQEFYPENDWFTIPVKLVKDDHGTPLILSLDMNGEELYYQIWRVNVGRVSLYLLDTNLPANSPMNRNITKRLYDSDRDIRLRQEILLGIGGIKALNALKLKPAVYHMNEGHSAFLILERLKQMIQNEGLRYHEAYEAVWATSLFTTHTPVPAGNERFHPNVIKKYLTDYARILDLSWNDFLGLGREDVENKEEEFCMTVLGLKFSGMSNGVSKLHGQVSRDMWKRIFQQIPNAEIPIQHVTNGVHTKTWLSKNMEGLFMRYLQTAYLREIADFTLWKVIDEVPDAELWFTHLERKKGLIKFARERMQMQMIKRGACASEMSKISEVLDPNILTIGFARRFAPYKRGDMIFRDVDRLARILNNTQMPIQIIYAGKAHPADQLGKDIIKKIFQSSLRPDLSRRIVFIEDYDIDVARYLVQGVDVWLNTPRRPLEASGTSGMKAAMNGALNLSIPDGWWDEAFNGENGWSIGHGETYNDVHYQDEIEANLLYRLLESEVAPAYYTRNEQGLPHKWIRMMKNSIRTCGDQYNAHRMLVDYLEQFYLKGEKRHIIFDEPNRNNVKALAAWRTKMVQNWNNIRILNVDTPVRKTIYAGDRVRISVQIQMENINPEDVIVEIYYGSLDQTYNITYPKRIPMRLENKIEHNLYNFTTDIECSYGGRFGHVIRVLPGHPHLSTEFVQGLIKWEE